jgi:hypothetical protein
VSSTAMSPIVGENPTLSHQSFHSFRQGEPMFRSILEEGRIHPTIREKVATYRTEMVKEVEAAIAANAVVVVGMRQNPFPRRARRMLDAAGIAYA